MSEAKLSMPLILGVGVLSEDPSDLRVQHEIVEAARNHRIQSLDTARHYVCTSFLLIFTPLILYSERREIREIHRR